MGAIMRIAKFHFFLFSSSLGAESKEQFLEEYARKNPELHNQMRGSTSFNFEGEPTQQPPEDRQKGDVLFLKDDSNNPDNEESDGSEEIPSNTVEFYASIILILTVIFM